MKIWHEISDEERVLWVTAAAFIIVVFGILIGVQNSLGYWQAAWSGNIQDTDSSLRLHKVMQIHETGNWFDPTLKRINPPDGLIIHWTRPLDGAMYAASWMVDLFVGDFQKSLIMVNTIFPIILYILLLGGAGWAVFPIWGYRAGTFLALLMILLQFPLAVQFRPGMADHHGPMLVLLITLLGGAIRILQDKAGPRLPWVMGGVIALASWVNGETMIPIFGILLTFGVAWLLKPGNLTRTNQQIAYAALACSIIALICERGPFMFENIQEIDRFSLFYVILFAILAAFWTAARYFSSSIIKRCILAVIGGAIGLTILILTQPQILEGRINTPDPTYLQLRGDKLNELETAISLRPSYTKPLWQQICDNFVFVWPLLLAIPMFIRGLIRRSLIHILLLVEILLFWRTGTITLRAMPIFAILTLIPATETIHYLGSLPRKINPGWGPTAVLTVGLLVIVSALSISALITVDRKTPTVTVQIPDNSVSPTSGQGTTKEEKKKRICRLDQSLLDLLNQEYKRAERPLLVVGFSDFSGPILFHTPHNVLSVPNHRAQPGFKKAHEILAAPDVETAHSKLSQLGGDIVLVCDHPGHKAFNGITGARNSFAAKLIAGGETFHSLPWITPLHVPEDPTDALHIYRIER